MNACRGGAGGRVGVASGVRPIVRTIGSIVMLSPVSIAVM